MKKVPIEQSVGMVLGHDVTEIVPGFFKGRMFKKGHLVRPEDVPKLLRIGKEHIYALNLEAGLVHENDAALRIARVAIGNGLTLTEPSEGRVNLIAETAGLLKINVDALCKINEVEEIVFSTIHTNQFVGAKRTVGGTRIIPLAAEDEKIRTVETICEGNRPVIEIRPLKTRDVGIVTTGSEIFHGRIQDRFGPVLHMKFAELGCGVLKQLFVSDDVEMTAGAIRELIDDGAGMVAVTGGMSVDPDDRTPAGIRAAGGKVVTYGAPVFPGAMFMLAYIDGIPILGLPGCVMYYKASIFDLIAPRILAGEEITRADIIALGHGGFCSNCVDCVYPICGFGKGV